MVVETKNEKQTREKVEYSNLLSELEQLKNNNSGSKKYILIVADEDKLTFHLYKFDFVEQVVWTLISAQTIAMNLIREKS